jgi:methylenetetrahydrofolate dehydrogenase (NADP+)/methenyltetrahydrofolate cyclohydrolase
MATIIDGKAVAKEVQKQIKAEVEGLERRWSMAPGLAVVLVGDDPASHIYIRNKEKACKDVGIKSFEHFLPATVSEKELLALVHQLNKDKHVHGILVQLPLPPHIRSERILQAISPYKDVDGFHPVNQGTLWLARTDSVRARRWA